MALASTDGDWPIRRVVEAGAFCFLGWNLPPHNDVGACLVLFVSIARPSGLGSEAPSILGAGATHDAHSQISGTVLLLCFAFVLCTALLQPQ